jgi:O-antigen/teichoic acid export membrane protein
VAHYSAPFEAVVRLWLEPTSLDATLFPAFSALGARDDHERLGRLASRGVKFVLLALGPVIVLVIAGAEDLLRLWLGEEFARESTLALQILACGVFVNSLALIPLVLVQGLGRPDLTAKFHLLELPLQVVLVWALVRAWGVPGAALAWTLRVALDAALLFGAAARMSSVSWRTFVSERVPQTAALLVAFAVPLTAMTGAAHAGWLRMALLGASVFALATVVWRYSLGAGDREHVLRLIPFVRLS